MTMTAVAAPLAASPPPQSLRRPMELSLLPLRFWANPDSSPLRLDRLMAETIQLVRGGMGIAGVRHADSIGLNCGIPG